MQSNLENNSVLNVNGIRSSLGNELVSSAQVQNTNPFLDKKNYTSDLRSTFENDNFRGINVEDNKNNLLEEHGLKSLEEIPKQYRNIFSDYLCFNRIQSTVFNKILYSDASLVVSAPTGSGKTALFELAIVKLLLHIDAMEIKIPYKIVYVAPVKALCEERLIDWHRKFSNFGLNSILVTGDSDNIDIKGLLNHNLIITTPEKWDSLTRKWKDNRKLVRLVKLFLIDEVHLLNEETRGSTLEAIVIRMKTLQSSLEDDYESNGVLETYGKIRFVAMSATIPNVGDIAEWLGNEKEPAEYFKFTDDTRPVKLKKIVLGYPYNVQFSPFKFDIYLNYRLKSILIQYAEGKPTLIFCSTRKSVEMTSKYIMQNITITLSSAQKQILLDTAMLIKEVNVREILIHGVGFHHAGLDLENRKNIENLFRSGHLPILVTTSTLAMGVNLPAHLVIVKSTKYYSKEGYKDYSEINLLQMIGRAGRPQFDTSATAVIMTIAADKAKYENMLGGEQPVESNLHHNLIEHLNAEVVLHTITHLAVAMEWVTSSFLRIRARKNPRHYNIPVGLTPDQIDKKLLEMCQIEINKLTRAGMLTIDLENNISISPTKVGYLMAKYYVAFDTMKLFLQISGHENLRQLLGIISKCQEFSEIYLRVNDKKSLNLLNKCRNRETIRFPLSGRIKTLDMKINCIIQAVFGCLPIMEPSLLLEAQKIMRIGERVTKCLSEYLESKEKCYAALLGALTLSKCFHTKLWENSPFVCKQLPGIGNVQTSYLVSSGKTTFQHILDMNPRDIERIIKRKPMLGNEIQEKISHLPKYNLNLEVDNKIDPSFVNLIIKLTNVFEIEDVMTCTPSSIMSLLIGDDQNNILFYEKYTHAFMKENCEVITNIPLIDRTVSKIFANFISEDWVGIDENFTLILKEEIVETTNTKYKKDINCDNQKTMQNYFNVVKKISPTVNEKLSTKENKDANVDKETNQSSKREERKVLKTKPKNNKLLSKYQKLLNNWSYWNPHGKVSNCKLKVKKSLPHSQPKIENFCSKNHQEPKKKKIKLYNPNEKVEFNLKEDNEFDGAHKDHNKFDGVNEENLNSKVNDKIQDRKSKNEIQNINVMENSDEYKNQNQTEKFDNKNQDINNLYENSKCKQQIENVYENIAEEDYDINKNQEDFKCVNEKLNRSIDKSEEERSSGGSLESGTLHLAIEKICDFKMQQEFKLIPTHKAKRTKDNSNYDGSKLSENLNKYQNKNLKKIENGTEKFENNNRWNCSAFPDILDNPKSNIENSACTNKDKKLLAFEKNVTFKKYKDNEGISNLLNFSNTNNADESSKVALKNNQANKNNYFDENEIGNNFGASMINFNDLFNSKNISSEQGRSVRLVSGRNLNLSKGRNKLHYCAMELENSILDDENERNKCCLLEKFKLDPKPKLTHNNVYNKDKSTENLGMNIFSKESCSKNSRNLQKANHTQQNNKKIVEKTNQNTFVENNSESKKSKLPETVQKSISWRSPLVLSQGIRYKPHFDKTSHKQELSGNNEELNDTKTTDMSFQSRTSSESIEKINPVRERHPRPNLKSTSTFWNNFFPLSDKESESTQTQKYEEKNDTSDTSNFLLESSMQNLRNQAEKRQSDQTSFVEICKHKRKVQSNSLESASTYYELLSQIQNPTKKQETPQKKSQNVQNSKFINSEEKRFNNKNNAKTSPGFDPPTRDYGAENLNKLVELFGENRSVVQNENVNNCNNVNVTLDGLSEFQNSFCNQTPTTKINNYSQETLKFDENPINFQDEQEDIIRDYQLSPLENNGVDFEVRLNSREKYVDHNQKSNIFGEESISRLYDGHPGKSYQLLPLQNLNSKKNNYYNVNNLPPKRDFRNLHNSNENFIPQPRNFDYLPLESQNYFQHLPTEPQYKRLPFESNIPNIPMQSHIQQLPMETCTQYLQTEPYSQHLHPESRTQYLQTQPRYFQDRVEFNQFESNRVQTYPFDMQTRVQPFNTPNYELLDRTFENYPKKNLPETITSGFRNVSQIDLNRNFEHLKSFQQRDQNDESIGGIFDQLQSLSQQQYVPLTRKRSFQESFLPNDNQLCSQESYNNPRMQRSFRRFPSFTSQILYSEPQVNPRGNNISPINFYSDYKQNYMRDSAVDRSYSQLPLINESVRNNYDNFRYNMNLRKQIPDNGDNCQNYLEYCENVLTPRRQIYNQDEQFVSESGDKQFLMRKYLESVEENRINERHMQNYTNNTNYNFRYRCDNPNLNNSRFDYF